VDMNALVEEAIVDFEDRLVVRVCVCMCCMSEFFVYFHQFFY
jgi:hypothetical protein